jgi:hypothetical protein
MAILTPSTLLGCAALAVAAGSALRPAPAIEIENTSRGTSLRIALGDGGRFSVVAQHSMYEQPVTEEFSVDTERGIVLTAVSSPSAAVREYFGIYALGERHPMDRAMREIVFRVAAGTPQRLRFGGVERSFLQLGAHGDRLVMRPARTSALSRWLSTFRSDAP